MTRDAALAVLFVALAPQNAVAQSTCTQTLNAGANVGSAISSAPSGATICLNDGNYPGFTLIGVGKSPRVTVLAVNSRQASFTGTVTIRDGSYGVTFDGVNFSYLLVGQAPNDSNLHDFTFRNYDMTGQLVVDYVTTQTPNLLFEYFTHNNITAATAPNARMVFFGIYPNSRTTPVATVRYGVIDGGCADGIQAGSPIIVEYTRFLNMQVGSCPNDPHTDAFQLYGGPFDGTIIRNNYFYRNVQVLTAYDGVDHVLIENNVFDPGPDGERRPCQIEWYSDDSSIIRHNTVLYRGSGYGSICMDRKSQDDAGFGTVIVDNIANDIYVANGSTVADQHHNLLRSGAGSGDVTGVPVYVEGSTPSTFEGFALANGSPGQGAASSPTGSDIGVLVSTDDVAPAAPSALRVE